MVSSSLPRVPVWKYVVIFCVIYFCTLIAVSYGMSFLEWYSTNVNMPVLIGSASLVKFIFARRHGRNLLLTEFVRILIFSMIFDCILQLVLVLAYCEWQISAVSISKLFSVYLSHGFLLAIGFFPWTMFRKDRNLEIPGGVSGESNGKLEGE